AAVRHQCRRLLYREQETLHIDIEDVVIVLLGDLAQRGILRDTGIREHDVKPALLPLDLREETIEIGKVRHVSLDPGDVSIDLLHRRRQLLSAPPGYVDVGALVHELLCRRKADATGAARDQRDLSIELRHDALRLPCSRSSASCASSVT